MVAVRGTPRSPAGRFAPRPGVPSAMTRPRSRTTTRSASAPTNFMSCSTRICVRPRSRSVLSACASLSFSAARSPAAGSSSRSSRGRWARARATESSRSCPIGSVVAANRPGQRARRARALRGPRPSRAVPRATATAVAASPRRIRRASTYGSRRRRSRARRGTRERVSPGRRPRPRRARRCAGQLVTSLPSTTMRPSSTGRNPDMQPRSVDLPAPFGPIRHVSEPLANSSVTSSTAATAPNLLVTPQHAATRRRRCRVTGAIVNVRAGAAPRRAPGQPRSGR